MRFVKEKREKKSNKCYRVLFAVTIVAYLVQDKLELRHFHSKAFYDVRVKSARDKLRHNRNAIEKGGNLVKLCKFNVYRCETIKQKKGNTKGTPSSPKDFYPI